MKWLVCLLMSVFLSSCATLGPTAFHVKENVVYKTVQGESLHGDFYIPKGAGPYPVVMVIHGGSWAARSGDMAQICRSLASRGFLAFNITYRLAPKDLYPRSVEDVRDAVAWLKAHAAEYGGNSEQISLWGYSAGAHLALLTGLDPKIGIKAIVAGGTPADFLAWPKSPIITKFIGGPLVEKRKEWVEASPVNHVRENSPPVFLYHGRRDDLVEVDQMYKMEVALKAKNRPVETYEIRYLGHVGVYLFSVEAVARGIRFIETQLRGRVDHSRHEGKARSRSEIIGSRSSGQRIANSSSFQRMPSSVFGL